MARKPKTIAAPEEPAILGEQPPPKAGKPDTSSVALRDDGVHVTYTDPDGVPHTAVCEQDQIRATTVRLAKEFGARR